MELKTILRIVELVIAVVLLVIWYVLGAYANRVMIVCGTVLGFVIICAVLVALEFMDFQDSHAFTLIGAILFIICGGISIGTMPDYGDGRVTCLIAGILFFCNGVVFLVDFIFEIKNSSGGRA
ncbi:PREDICTED: uncharacterized protein LOC108377969 [Rhagoletis zephyria]|uniref:uncharacterized protein LOC108377969 n=1 Tax=Rhagoletis zephyria TaxID=28612 RepID=UPI00081174B3|nr:PREDICTED: uncharacterized protein LOC108377969 [Rhagoletis zephyria]